MSGNGARRANKLVLFDIDGTLLLTAGAGRRAVLRALLDSVGAPGPFEGVRFDGKTDPQIVRELLSAAGHEDADSEKHIRAVCDQYIGLLERELVETSRKIRVLAGVAEMLDGIEARTDAVLGLLTGNIERGAHLKLSHAGLDPGRFRVGAFGSDAEARSALPAFAVRRAAAVMGYEPRGDAVVIIGDTPADMTCGDSLGARAIGVATGAYTVAELDDAGAFAAFDDLSDHTAVMAAIFA